MWFTLIECIIFLSFKYSGYYWFVQQESSITETTSENLKNQLDSVMKQLHEKEQVIMIVVLCILLIKIIDDLRALCFCLSAQGHFQLRCKFSKIWTKVLYINSSLIFIEKSLSKKLLIKVFCIILINLCNNLSRLYSQWTFFLEILICKGKKG